MRLSSFEASVLHILYVGPLFCPSLQYLYEYINLFEMFSTKIQLCILHLNFFVILVSQCVILLKMLFFKSCIFTLHELKHFFLNQNLIKVLFGLLSLVLGQNLGFRPKQCLQIFCEKLWLCLLIRMNEKQYILGWFWIRHYNRRLIIIFCGPA